MEVETPSEGCGWGSQVIAALVGGGPTRLLTASRIPLGGGGDACVWQASGPSGAGSAVAVESVGGGRAVVRWSEPRSGPTTVRLGEDRGTWVQPWAIGWRVGPAEVER